MRGLWSKVLLALVLIEAAVIAAPRVRSAVFAPEPENQVARGARLAASMGCFACHGPGGTGGHPNPGSASGEVPGFSGGVPMMYAEDDAELLAYIDDGLPPRRANDAAYKAKADAALLRMPAFKSRLAPGDAQALVAYVKAAAGLSRPSDDTASKGWDVATANGCFGCHGAGGAGGVRNPGSLKGVIPGFLGTDFSELVKGDDELRGWIRDGSIPRLANNPAAEHFLAGQVVHMPAFGKHLSDADLAALVALLHALRAHPS